jgi:hypothetical protein
VGTKAVASGNFYDIYFRIFWYVLEMFYFERSAKIGGKSFGGFHGFCI